MSAIDYDQALNALRASGGRAYRVEASQSTVRIYAYRAGSARRLGHNHILGAEQFEGEVRIAGDDPALAGFVLRAPLAALRIDEAEWRSALGGAFDSARSTEDIDGTRRNLLGEKGLDATRYPEVVLRSVAVAGDWPVLVVRLAVSLHGQTREQDLVLRVEHDEQSLRARGSFLLRQSDFGLTPFSVLGGLLAVQDAVAIDVDLRAVAGSS